MWQGRRALRVVEGRRDENKAGEDQRKRREAESEGGRDAERVVDARTDVAVAGGKERRGAECARQLGGAPDDDAEVSWPAAAPGDRLRAHRTFQPNVIDRGVKPIQ